MLNDETKRKIRELNIGEIITALEFQEKEPEMMSLSFDERLQRVIDYLYQEKYNSKIQRLIRIARFRLPQADIHSIHYDGRAINREMINELSIYLSMEIWGCFFCLFFLQRFNHKKGRYSMKYRPFYDYYDE